MCSVLCVPGRLSRHVTCFCTVSLLLVSGMLLREIRDDYITVLPPNVIMSYAEVVDYIQRISWHWLVNNIAKGPCLLYEWVWNPGDSMLR
ncbi:hypothetical protein TSUD_414050 [Trifolium subterraneum]|uniref:Uncharacterized protein n=1 Tax=Trifolium subterraneum TaxID=3900 RepID=A0A2Z6P537_TRISU|nr:hypothetical protein TSUD_414050 [Trifolium subterraneum]